MNQPRDSSRPYNKGTRCMLVLFFDTETTGLPRSRRAAPQQSALWPNVVQLSWIIYDIANQVSVDSQDLIIQLPRDAALPKESVAIHGITRARMNTKGVPISVALDAFEAAASRADLVVAHNLEFDLNVLKAELWRTRRAVDFQPPLGRAKQFCTMVATKKLCNLRSTTRDGREFVKFPKLEELHSCLFGSEHGHMHDAMGDVIACLRCYCMLFHGYDVAKGTDKALVQLWRLYS